MKSNYFTNLKDFKWIKNKTNSQLLFAERQLMSLYVQNYKENLKQIKAFYFKYADSKGKISYLKVAKYNRLKSLNEQLVKLIKELYNQNTKEITKSLSINMQLNFNGVGWATQNAINTSLPWTALNKKAIELAIQNPVSGLTLTENLERHRQEILWKVKRALVQNMIQGEAYPIMAEKLKNIFDGDFSKTKRVLRTESHRVCETASYLAYEEVEEQGIDATKTWVATLDNKTRDSHQTLDGQTVKIKEYFTSELGNQALYPGGFGVAEEDVNCRCTTVMNYNKTEKLTRHSRINGETQGKYVEKMTYSEWAKTKSLQ